MIINNYSKNFILLGDLNYHCLVCEGKEPIQTVDDLEKHIRLELHRERIKDLSPMPKFEKDRIFKIRDKYFCEHCNQVCNTLSDVLKHIENENHQKNKNNPKVELTQCGQIVIGDDKNIIKICNREWYGVIDMNCIFCDVIVDHFATHISLSDHMITMIQSKIVHNEDGLFYREFKDRYGYCFLCKTTFEMASKSDHWKNELHTEKMKVQVHTELNVKTDQERKTDVTIELINSQKGYFDIDLKNKVATCKICTAYVNINFMIEHKKIHNITDKDKIKQVPIINENELIEKMFTHFKKPKFYDHGKLRAELAKFGREYGIKLIFPGDKGFCSHCGVYIFADMVKFYEHITGSIHKYHLEWKCLHKGLIMDTHMHSVSTDETKKIKDFIKTLSFHKDLGKLLINNQFYVEISSFMLITFINDLHCKKFKCHACDIIYDHKKNKDHCASEEHSKIFDNADFVINYNYFEDELIRKIRPNLYHCAFCNLSFAFSEALDMHLDSDKHDAAKRENVKLLKERVGQQGLALEVDGLIATLLALHLDRNE